MRVPLTTRDFLDRAELVYGDRVGVVDEPTLPAPSLGEVTYRELARRGRAFLAGLDALGVGEGDRIAVVSHNSARLLESYTATVLKRVWRAQWFSFWMTSLLHRFPDASDFDLRRQVAELQMVTSSPTAAKTLADHYTGLPLA